MFRVKIYDRQHYLRHDRFGLTQFVEHAGKWTREEATRIANSWTDRGYRAVLEAVY